MRRFRPGLRVRAFAAALAVSAAAMAAYALAPAQQFPHEEHEGLFPVCTGCHQGVETGDSSAYYPAASTCLGCHDGERQERVEYEPPRPGGPSLVAFSHTAHDRETDRELDCTTCHVQPGAPAMAVEHAVVQTCLDCHPHDAPDHLVSADCGTCHRPFASSGLPPVAALALPRPATHDVAAFLAESHGELAAAEPGRCAVCHTRERCAACHVDAAAQPVIAALPQLEGAALPVSAARYPVPPSHLEPHWLELHGGSAAAAPADCATCHTRQDCASCHRERVPPAVGQLADVRRVVAPGVGELRRAPAGHARPEFATEHGVAASADIERCAACHVRLDCESCHQAVTSPEYHPPNFADRHAAAAYARSLDCSSCHSTERFCRDCHRERGTVASGRLSGGFHDAQPLWLLRHGQAARQGLESCATCHVQRDCMQCHSQTGSFRISPHGPDFDPERAQGKNARVCFACHLGDPLGST